MKSVRLASDRWGSIGGPVTLGDKGSEDPESHEWVVNLCGKRHFLAALFGEW